MKRSDCIKSSSSSISGSASPIRSTCETSTPSSTPAQCEATLLDIREFMMEKQFELPHEEEAVRRHEHLDFRLAETKDRPRDFADQLRIEVGFGLVPEQAAIVVQRVRGDQPHQHGELAPAFGNQWHLHVAGATGTRRPQVETTTLLFQKHAPADLFFQGRQQFSAARCVPPPDSWRAEQQAGVAPRLIEFQVVGLVQRDESRVDRQQFAGGQEHRNTVAPRRGEVLDDDFGSVLCGRS